ncbi:MAG: redoxin domain-containing protein, partial [Dehalococcoidales bacterium]|nr:redoxin domain-containing protein [Dehalococcoidales bacterium]
MISAGAMAPDFKLKDQNGKTVKLSSFKGKKVLLSFRPLAWTAVCQ